MLSGALNLYGREASIHAVISNVYIPSVGLCDDDLSWESVFLFICSAWRGILKGASEFLVFFRCMYGR